MSLPPLSLYPSPAMMPARRSSVGVCSAAWHSLFWLVFANAMGVLIAILLLLPGLSTALGEWTYGRWVMAHMNLELYGWTSLPMAGFLFKVYGADRGSLARWCRPVLWVWSAALFVGFLSWMSGHSSGKLFLDWSGYARIFFPLAMLGLWLLLAVSFVRGWKQKANRGLASRVAKVAGLALLLAVPIAIYVAAGPGVYPPINPDSGGPTGASQLESSLAIVAILLILPFGLTRRRGQTSWVIAGSWAMVAVEFILCFALGRGDIGHHRPAQYLSLASLLIWMPLTPAYYAAFVWHPATRAWRIAFLCWWSVLVPTGWVLFLPGVLDHFKFTDVLVGHSLLAMAGFTSSLLIFVMVQLLGDDGWIFNRPLSFHVWNGSVLAYVLVMFAAGWREGFDPAFTIVHGPLREVLYTLRLAAGILIFAASLDWLVDATKLLREPGSVPAALPLSKERTA